MKAELAVRRLSQRDVHIGRAFDRDRGIREEILDDRPDVFPHPGMVVSEVDIGQIFSSDKN